MSSTLSLQELAQSSLNLLEQRSQTPEPKVITIEERFLGRPVLAKIYEDGRIRRFQIINPVTPRPNIINGPILPFARRRGDQYRESPLELMAARRRRQFSSPKETPFGIPSWVPWHSGRRPEPEWDPSMTPTRRNGIGAQWRVGWRGNWPPKTPSGIKLRFRIRKPVPRTTRSKHVTDFFALDTKGNPAKLT